MPVLPQYEKDSVSPHPSMPDLTININAVNKLLKNLKLHKAAGPDTIRPLLLKELYMEISPVLTCSHLYFSEITGDR